MACPNPSRANGTAIDPNDPHIIEKALERGILLPQKYFHRQCVKVSAQDNCLPTGFVDAATKGEPYKSLWEIEVMIDSEKADEADLRLKEVMKNFPNEPRSYWLASKNIFFRGERMSQQQTEAKGALYEEGMNLMQKCVELAPQEINCLLHHGTMVGRWSTNQGLIKSARNGKTVERSWKSALETNQHYRFSSGNTSMAATHYGMGVFYRLVPDSFLMKLFFGVRGDIEKSIMHIQKAVETNEGQIELRTELTAALLCKSRRDDSDIDRIRGAQQADACMGLKPNDTLDRISQNDCKRLKENPDLGCGYSRDKQQETNPDKFKTDGKQS